MSLSERQSVRQAKPRRSMLSARDFVVSAEYRKKSLMRNPASEGLEIAAAKIKSQSEPVERFCHG
jgi:hypothetical protein